MKNILVVDDYAVTRRLLEHILELGNYTTYMAANGVEALAILAEENIDLVICDIAMPGMDGLTLLRRLRAEAGYEAIPVLMLTASGQDEDRIAALEGGATDFLTKPVGTADLLAIVQRLLG